MIAIDKNSERNFKMAYFGLAFLDLLAEFFMLNKLGLIFIKSITVSILILLYWRNSTQREPLFFISYIFFLITRIFIVFNDEGMLFFGILAFFINRLTVIYYLKKLLKLKDYFPVLIAMVPFLFFFFYLLSQISELATRSYFGLLLHNILMSTLAGMILSQYIMDSIKKDFWLLLFGLFSVAQYFVVFIEKFYLLNSLPTSFRLLAVLLTTTVNFAFYNFVIETERSNQD